jgi:hypothetical protein
MLSGIGKGFRPGQNRSLFCVGLHFVRLVVVSVFLLLGGPGQAKAANATNVEATVKLRVEGSGDQAEKPRDLRHDQFVESFPWELAIILLVLGWVVKSCVEAHYRCKESWNKQPAEILSTLSKGALAPEEIKSTIQRLEAVTENLKKLHQDFKW